MNYNDYLEIQLGERGSSYGTKIPECIAIRNNYCQQNFSDIDRSKKILEIGCGDGVNLNWFKKAGFWNVVGSDIDRAKLQLAHENTGFEVKFADIHYLDEVFKEDSFDIVLASHCLEHCLYPQLAVAHIHSILKDAGFLYVVLPYPEEYDPNNISHVSNDILGMGVLDSGDTIVKFFTGDGLFALAHRTLMSREIWITLSKLS